MPALFGAKMVPFGADMLISLSRMTAFAADLGGAWPITLMPVAAPSVQPQSMVLCATKYEPGPTIRMASGFTDEPIIGTRHDYVPLYVRPSSDHSKIDRGFCDVPDVISGNVDIHLMIWRYPDAKYCYGEGKGTWRGTHVDVIVEDRQGS